MRTGFAIRMSSEDSSPPNLYPRFSTKNSITEWTPDPVDATLFETMDMAVEKSKLIGGWANLDIVHVEFTENGTTRVVPILVRLREWEKEGLEWRKKGV